MEDTYKLFGHFKEWIIDVAVEQINKYSDLECSYTQHKTGRAVTHLIFNFDLKLEFKIAKAAEQAAKEVAKEIKLNSKPAKKRTTKLNVKPEPPMPKIYTPEEAKPTGEETDKAKKGKEFLRNFLQRKKTTIKSAAFLVVNQHNICKNLINNASLDTKTRIPVTVSFASFCSLKTK